MDIKSQEGRASDQEKEKLLKELLGRDYKATAGHLPILKEAIDLVSSFDHALSVADLVPAMNTALSSSRVLSFTANSASVISVFMFPVITMINIADAYQTGHRMYAYRCIAYTITSWAFEKPIPASSIRILNNLRGGDLVARQTIINEYHKVWRETSQPVITRLNHEISVNNISKQALQLVLRALGGDNPQKLCDVLMKRFEEKMSKIAILTWKKNYSIKYPN